MIPTNTVISPEQRDQWLAERTTGIGASEAAAVCGVSRWQSPLAIYKRKVCRDQDHPPEVEESESTYWGHVLEPIVIAEYERRQSVEVIDRQLFVRSAKHPHMFATLDGRRRDNGRPVEAKTIGLRSAGELGDREDDVPVSWICQAHHQMVVTGADQIDFAVLVGGQDFRIYTVRYTPELAEQIVVKEAAFWDRVQRLEPPEPTCADDARVLQEIYRRAEGSIALDSIVLPLVEQYEELGREITERQEQRERLKADLLSVMKDFAAGSLPDGRVVSRKVIERKPYTVQPKPYVMLSIRKATR